LIDGEQLVEKLKDLRLGVKVAMVENVEVSEDWFRSL
jgi:restriction system protein